MKCGINKLLWPCVSITVYNEINCVCVALCEAVICSEHKEVYNAYMCDTWHLFKSILPKYFGLETFGLIKPYLQNMCYSKKEANFEDNFEKAMSTRT